MSDQAIAMPQELIGVVADENVTRFDRAVPDAHFSLPAHPTCGQQLDYYSRYAETRGETLYRRMWYSAKILITEWECSALPDPKADVDKITSPEATTVMMWAGDTVAKYMNDLEILPKV